MAMSQSFGRTSGQDAPGPANTSSGGQAGPGPLSSVDAGAAVTAPARASAVIRTEANMVLYCIAGDLLSAVVR